MTELGQRLKGAREEKGLSLDSLQELTKIQKRYLVAIEEGNYGIMPGKFYTRAFIKQYAEAVGLHSDEIFEEYKDEIPAPTTTEMSPQLSRVKTSKKAAPSRRRNSAANALPMIMTITLIVLLIAAVWIFLQGRVTDEMDSAGNPENSSVEKEVGDNVPEETDGDEEEGGSDPGTDEDQEQEPAEEEAPEQELVQTEQKGKRSIYDLKNADKLVLNFTSPGESYLRVRNDNGKVFYDGIVSKDKPLELDVSGESSIELNIGRAYELDIQINGEPFTYPADPRKTMHQYVTINKTADAAQ
nr:helix-turn-helix domain-containing protein [Bacillus marinisedimentorum]